MWHDRPIEHVERELETSVERGLTSDEAARRLARDGPNLISIRPARPWWPLLVSQFTGPLTVILLVAVAISALIGEVVDAAVIGVIVLVNGVLGFVQEWRAGRAIEALAAMMVPRATVRRDGMARRVDAAELVRGDRVEVEPGDRVPADLRVASASSLTVDESALTGEPAGVHKQPDAVTEAAPIAERSSMLFAGTDVRAGHGSGLVTSTGHATEFGSIVDLTASADRVELPLQRSLAHLSRRLGLFAVAVAAATVLVGIGSGRPAEDMFFTGVSLAVAVVPEGLPAVVTVTLALGIRSMARRHALLRNLEAAETLGAASVICTDKTGTLTQNRMTVRTIWVFDRLADLDTLTIGVAPPPGPGSGPDTATRQFEELLLSAETASHASISDDGAEVGDPMDVAIVRFARSVGLPPPNEPVVAETPFDAQTRSMSVTTRCRAGSEIEHRKGAVEAVLGSAGAISTESGTVPITALELRRIESALDEMTTRGLRAIGVTRAADGHPDTLLGLIGFHDPPRPEVAEAVSTARSAGIDIVVLTGDAGGTALAVAKEVGLPATRVVTGSDLDALSDDEVLADLDGSCVLARVAPIHKMRVVRTLQDSGAVVAMTGDGVNDAPALEQASIGVAMGERGTDVAREAADVVLADDNFASIVAAVEEGRRQYSNIGKFIRYLLSSNLGEVIAISGSVLLGWPLILLPAQILWMNLLTDGLTALALGVEEPEPDLMERPPRDPQTPILDRNSQRWIVAMGAIIGVTTLLIFRWTLGTGEGADLERAQTMAFTGMVLLEKMNVFNFRAERLSLREIGVLSNRWLIVAWVGALALQVGAVHLPLLSDALGTRPLSLTDWGVLTLIALPVLVIGEFWKALARRR